MRLDNTYLCFKRKTFAFWICLPFLYMFSFLYQGVSTCLRCAYSLRILPSYRSKLPVISVGNITLGGTGKTPLVEMAVRFFIKHKKHPGIIIRGYKKPRDNKISDEKSKTNYFEFGDEASMLKENLSACVSVCVGKDKNKSARQLELTSADIIIVDDGFQHWRLKRDLDIVVIDSTYSLGEQKLLPVGRLREPLSSLKRADIFILTKTDFHPENLAHRKKELQKINPHALMVSSVYEALCFCDIAHHDECCDLPLNEYQKKPVFILVGIANPFYFDKLISSLGVQVVREFIFPDHYEYTKSDIGRIKEFAHNLGVQTIITTQKDAQRLIHLLDELAPLCVLSLKIKVKITENEEAFYDRLLSVCSG